MLFMSVHKKFSLKQDSFFQSTSKQQKYNMVETKLITQDLQHKSGNKQEGYKSYFNELKVM